MAQGVRHGPLEFLSARCPMPDEVRQRLVAIGYLDPGGDPAVNGDPTDDAGRVSVPVSALVVPCRFGDVDCFSAGSGVHPARCRPPPSQDVDGQPVASGGAHPLCGGEGLVYTAKSLSCDSNTSELTCGVNARTVSVPNTLTKGSVADADAMNENFTELEVGVNAGSPRARSRFPIHSRTGPRQTRIKSTRTSPNWKRA